MRMRCIPALLLLLGGCAADTIATLPPGTPSDEMAKRFGQPTQVWREKGGEVWEYAYGPQGTRTYIAGLDAEGRLISVAQVLDEAHFALVKPGEQPQEILRLLGRPGGEWTYPVIGERIWSYRYLEPATRPMYFNVHFDAGTGLVKTTSRSRDPSEEMPGMRLR